MNYSTDPLATTLLVIALAAPIVVFCLLKFRLRQRDRSAVPAAIVAGWALNIVWALVANQSVGIAAGFGWLCPSVLVGVCWLLWRFAGRRAA